MTAPSLALQSSIRSQLVAWSPLTAVVPATSIMDADLRPNVDPAIIFGHFQVLPGELLSRKDYVIHADLHIWAIEPSTATVKTIGGLIRDALYDWNRDLTDYYVGDLMIETERYMRDPDGQHAHGVITLRAVLGDLS